MEFYQFCPKILPNLYVSVTTKKLSNKVCIFQCLPQNAANEKTGREMVMENQEMFMENSWKNILSSMWEPCYQSGDLMCFK